MGTHCQRNTLRHEPKSRRRRVHAFRNRVLLGADPKEEYKEKAAKVELA
jgi:hypothetical protein